MKRGEENKEVAYSSLPNDERRLFKVRNEELFGKCKLKNEAISLYNKIISV